MKYYAVWSGVKDEDPRGRERISWGLAGIFKAENAESACQAAARKSQRMGTFFAIEGYPWGIDLMEQTASEFGIEDRVSEAERQGRELEQKIAQLSRLQQLEIRSREMERDAGIGGDDAA